MTVMLAALLGVLNFYPAQAVRRLIINSKEADLLERARTLATELEGFATLNQENINVSMQVLDLGEDQRILVTDNFGSVIYDNAKAWRAAIRCCPRSYPPFRATTSSIAGMERKLLSPALPCP